MSRLASPDRRAPPSYSATLGTSAPPSSSLTKAGHNLSQWFHDRLFKPDFRHGYLPRDPSPPALLASRLSTIDAYRNFIPGSCHRYPVTHTPAASSCSSSPRASSCEAVSSPHHIPSPNGPLPLPTATLDGYFAPPLSAFTSPSHTPPASRPVSVYTSPGGLAPARWSSANVIDPTPSLLSRLHPARLETAEAIPTLSVTDDDCERSSPSPSSSSPSVGPSAADTHPLRRCSTASQLPTSTSRPASFYHLLPMKPAPAVEIVVFDNPLVIRGNADEAAGSLLRGQLVLRLHDTIKIKSINLRLKGREHVFWSEGFGNHQSLFREKRDLIDHEWSFLDSATTPVASPSASPSLSSATKQKKNHAHPFGPGEYVYDFDLVIPGDLPETTHTEHGHVTYKLKAVVERTTFHMNMVHETVLPVKRQPLPSSTEWLQSLVIEDSWEPYITYQINAPSKIYSDGTTIPLSLNFTPQTKGVRVLAASALLKEYVRYTTSDRFSVRRLNQVITRVDKHFQPPSATREGANTDDVYDETGALRAEIALKVPQAYREVQYDASTNFMEISHKLKVLIKLRDHNRKVHHIYIAAPVCIMHGDFEEAATLPPYIRADPDHTLLVGTSVGDVDSPAASAVPYVASRFTGASAGLLQTVPSAGDFSDLMHHRFVATSHPGSPAISRRASLSTPEQSSLDQQLSVTESSATVSPPVFGLTPPPPPYSLVVTSGSR